MSPAWVSESTEEFARSFRRSRKRHEASCDGALTRLQHFQDRWLNNPQLAPGFHLPGWVHPEGKGVLAVDQGTKGNLAAIRLYLYLDHPSRRIWLLRTGDKQSQHADIAYCHVWVERFKSGHGHAHD
jgi:hypothetical protein